MGLVVWTILFVGFLVGAVWMRVSGWYPQPLQFPAYVYRIPGPRMHRTDPPPAP